jgi:hypothetical protein
MAHFVRVLTIALICAAALACDESLSSLAGPTPSLEPTFASIQQEIFESTDSSGRSACTNCHTNVGHAPAGGLNLTHDAAYDQLVNVPSREKPGAVRVIPGDAEGSYLIHKLEGASDIKGVRMPFSGPPYLTDGQIAIIKRWIAIGAPRS